MFNSPALEVAIGLVFCFASVALMASAAKEACASLAALRAVMSSMARRIKLGTPVALSTRRPLSAQV